jgi:hypothetical protein
VIWLNYGDYGFVSGMKSKLMVISMAYLLKMRKVFQKVVLVLCKKKSSSLCL